LRFSTLVLPVLSASAIACHSPTAPSSAAWKQLLPAWSPHVVLQPDSNALRGHGRALAQLVSHAAIESVRISLTTDGSAAPTVHMASALGVQVIGIINNADLRARDLSLMFDWYADAYPEVRVFQVGNEVTTATPRMSVDEYVAALTKISSHVRDRYPTVTLISEAAFGSGGIGAADVAAMAPRLMAAGIGPEQIIIGINVYTDRALTAYAGTLTGALSRYRIWVTETGVPDQARQISWVENVYPALRTSLRAERIYWYALWAGDSGPDRLYSLIQGPTTRRLAAGPLFQLLTQAN
jgi:predicted CxxxxCH...CXXCH cytochrome family protein